MSTTYVLQLTRKKALVIAVCCSTAGLLLFLAGAATGLLLVATTSRAASEDARATKPQPLTSQAPVEAVASTETETLAGPAKSTDTGILTLATVPPTPPAGQNAQPAQKSSSADAKGDSAMTGTKAQAVAPSVENTIAVPLAIRVCSFSARASAQNMVDDLAIKGYRASMVRSKGAQGRDWYVVKLGPYTEWTTASDIAARIAIAEKVRPEVGPMQ